MTESTLQSMVSGRGQTVVPKAVRSTLGVKPGDKLNWIIEGNIALVFVASSDPVRALRGILEGHGSYTQWLQERDGERLRERAAERQGGA